MECPLPRELLHSYMWGLGGLLGLSPDNVYLLRGISWGLGFSEHCRLVMVSLLTAAFPKKKFVTGIARASFLLCSVPLLVKQFQLSLDLESGVGVAKYMGLLDVGCRKGVCSFLI